MLPSSSKPIVFSAAIRGTPNMKYVYGVDPASESDNFAIVILEVHPDHKCDVVYCECCEVTPVVAGHICPWQVVLALGHLGILEFR